MNNADLVQQHSKFLTRLAIRFAGRIGFEEFYQAGALGLLEAAQYYDEKKGVKFLSFASRFIYHRMIEVLRVLYYPVRIPMHRNKLINRVRKQGRFSEADKKELGITDAEACYYEGFVEPTARVSVDHNMSDAGLYEQRLLEKIMYKEISDFVWNQGDFSDRERLVLFLNLGLGGYPPHSLRKILDMYPDIFCSLAQVMRVANEAKEKLREYLDS